MSQYTIMTGPPEESDAQRLIRYDFIASVWAIILVGVAILAYWVRHPNELTTNVYILYPHRQVLGPIVMSLMFGIAWYHVYRRAGDPARTLAAIFGSLLIPVLVVQIGRASIGVPTSGRFIGVLVYVMIFHFACAIWGSRLRLF